MMFLSIVREMRGLVRPYGFLPNRSSVGGSVARAREANVSMMRFTHSMGTARRGDTPWAQEPMKHSMTATTLTVSWNCRNLEIESYTFLPHMHAFTMEVKLSSVRMMSDAFFATSVPAMPWKRYNFSFELYSHGSAMFSVNKVFICL